MSVKRRIIEICCLILIIIVISSGIILLKNKLTNSYDSNVIEASDISKELGKTDIPMEAEAITNELEEQIIVSGTAVAVIDIPSIKTRGQVMIGTDDNTLMNYIGMFKGSAYPGQVGNFAVAAHNNIYTEIFKNLHKIQYGDIVRVITREKEYVYTVTSIEEILPTQVEVLKATEGKKEITLLTCTDFAKTRICVKGELYKVNDL